MTLHAGPMVHKNLICCQECGFVHWHPLPDASTVAKLYEGDNFYAGDAPHSPPDWFLKEKREHEQGYWRAYYDYLASFFQHKWVIDIGAGSGRFVHHLSKKGYTVWGVEPSEEAKHWSPVRDLMYDDELLMDENLKGNIVLILTLEHILDPETWLREKVLPHLDGRLIVVVPNEWNPIQKIVMAPNNPWFISPVHLNYFEPKTLRGLLEKVGLRVISEGSTFPMEAAILLGYDYRGSDSRGRRVHQFRLKLEKLCGPRIYRLYQLLYKYLGIGRELIFVAEKA